jgi:hypothetical protein
VVREDRCQGARVVGWDQLVAAGAHLQGTPLAA